MSRKVINKIIIELEVGDIIDQPGIDAIVNAANARLRIGGGVAGSIHSAGDPELERETQPLAPISPGEAVITSAPNLPNKHIIHCLGPVYGRDKPEDKILENCYKNALALAEEYQLKSIAFPAISTGAFGYPMKKAATVAFNAIKEATAELRHLNLVRFVLWNESDYNIHRDVLKEI
ncbi:MAG: macro domain-containing protein [Balneolaceae bacterium]